MLLACCSSAVPPSAYSITSKRAPLLIAAWEGHIDIVRHLLEFRADTEAKDTDGMSAIHYAAFPGHTEIVRLLLENGSDIEAKDQEEKTALGLLMADNQLDMARLLPTFIVLFQFEANMDDTALEALRNQRGKAAASAMETCLSIWQRERGEGKELTLIPDEVFDQGADAISVYMTALSATASGA
ncbi:hypothetical protein ATCC90586_003259 [Pythium insidiosum]|nr:hypothetical protein ATCC90586_003259 [Pythium insidiosum]